MNDTAEKDLVIINDLKPLIHRVANGVKASINFELIP